MTELKELVVRLRELPTERGRKKLKFQTYAERKPDGTVTIRLHETDIITVTPTGRVIVTSGGWCTNMTKDRLDSLLCPHFRVYTEKKVWYLVSQGSDWDNKAARTLFEDGMILGRKSRKNPAVAERKTLVLIKRVKEFAKTYVMKLRTGEIAAPGVGDCWLCSMLDEATHRCVDGQHLLSHLEEPYYVPRMVYEALQWRSSQMMKWEVQKAWNRAAGSVKDEDQEHDFLRLWQDIEKCLYRWMLMNLGLPY